MENQKLAEIPLKHPKLRLEWFLVIILILVDILQFKLELSQEMKLKKMK